MLDSPALHSLNRGFNSASAGFPALGCAPQSRTHSSAGERSLHTGEVQGSIPCASTRTINKIRYFLNWLAVSVASIWHVHAEQSTKWRAVTCKIRAACSPDVLGKI